MTRRAVIVGGGHNGLVCSCYLAEQGWDVTILERRPILGGAAVTEEFHPGFRNSTASYTVSLLNPRVIQDLNLHEHGLRFIERQVSNLLPLPDADYLMLYPDQQRTIEQINRFSTSDGQAYVRYSKDLGEVIPLVSWLMQQIPPAVANGGLADLVKAFQVSRRFAQIDTVAKQRLLKLFSLSAEEFLSEYFESEPIKAVLGFDAIVGHFDSPRSPGSAYVLLHHLLGEINGKPGVWAHAVGGMGAITTAMQREAAVRGVKMIPDAAVTRIETSHGKATATVTRDGRHYEADLIVANVNPRMLFLDLLDDNVVPADIHAHFVNYRCQSGTFRMNVALKALPVFACNPPAEALGGGIIMAPDLDYMHEAYEDARRSGWSKAPIVEMLIPSLVDDGLAPTGQHVASLFCQQFDPKLREGWDSKREAAAGAIFDVVERFAPGFRDLLLGTQIHSPWDLEQKFGLVGGDIFHGRLSLDQIYSARPMLGMGQYRTHIDNLYLCGAGTHPGGGVSGLPGFHAAHEIIRRH